MIPNESWAIILGTVLVVFASGFSITNVFVFVPMIVVLGIYFHVFKSTQYPHVHSEGKAVFITGEILYNASYTHSYLANACGMLEVSLPDHAHRGGTRIKCWGKCALCPFQ